MSLKSYYEKELTKLYEEAHYFSLEFPEQASALNLEKNKVTDPNVARMLEGCAFLSAKIHQMVDDESDFLPSQLIQQLWPQLAQGFPSVCMTQAIPSSSLKETIRIPAGAVLKSHAVGEENTECRFQTSQDLFVFPLKLSAAGAQFSSGQSLTLDFETLDGCSLDKIQWNSLCFYLDALFPKASAIIHFLLASNLKTILHVEGCSKEVPDLTFHSNIFLEGEQLNPQSHLGNHAQQLIFEAFAYPDKLQSLKLKGLEKIDFPQGSKRFRIELKSQVALTDPFEISQSDFKLYTIPSVNRFEQDCEPISFDHKHHHYVLRPEQSKPASVQVLSVLSVVGTCELDHESFTYARLSQISSHELPHYSLNTRSVNAEHSEVFLSPTSPNQKKQTLSVRAIVSNAHYPRRYLRSKALTLENKYLSSQLEMSNFSVPSAYLPQDFSKRPQFLLNQLRVQVEDLTTAEQLRDLLLLLNRSVNQQVIKRINAIKTLSLKASTLIKKGVFYQVHHLIIDLDENGFISLSDAFLFGKQLHAFFRASTSISCCVQTEVITHPSEKNFQWLS